MIDIFVYIVEFLKQYPPVTIIISFIVGLIAMPYVLKVSIRKQLVVKPNKRTSHKGNIPNVGGINIFTSFFITFFVFNASDLKTDEVMMFAGLYLIFIVGFFDDLISFSAKKKLIGELVSAFLLIVLANVRLTNLHGFLWISGIPDELIIVSYGASLFLFLLIINSLNLIDGVDGLATGIGMVICAFFGVYFQLIGEIALSMMAYILIGSLAIFFIYNVFGKRSKIFMGDSGALVLGYIIYIFIVKFLEANQLPARADYFMYAAPAMSACVLAVPLFDTLRVMITRIKKGHSPFKADKNHVHHLLLSMELKHRQVTFILVLVNLSFIGLAIIGHDWRNSILGAAAVLLAVVYIVVLWRLVDRYKKKHAKKNVLKVAVK